MAIALGWHVFNLKGTEIICHEGGTGGFRSFIGFSKTQRLGIVVLGNSESDVSDLGFHLFDSRSPLAKYQPQSIDRRRSKAACDLYRTLRTNLRFQHHHHPETGPSLSPSHMVSQS